MKKLYSCVLYDMKEGIVKMFPLYLLGIFVIIFLTMDAMKQLNINVSHPSVTELFIQIFQGKKEYQPIQEGPPFELDNAYLTITVILGLFACYYPKREWKLRGNIFITRYESKAIWWWSKSIWCILQLFLFFILLFFTVWGIAAINGNIGFQISKNAATLYHGTLLTTNASEVLLHIFCLGFFTAIALNQMQITLQLIFSPLAGFLVLIGTIILSGYSFEKYLVGNHYMLLRTAIFREDGITLTQGLLTDAILWILSVTLGYIAIQRKDIF